MAVNRETDENGKPIVVVGNDYSWVKGEVRDLPSLFLDVESIEEIGEPSLFVREGSGVKLRFLPCGGEERVYFRGLGWEYFYTYTTVFIDIGIRFPFTEFECGVLNQLKCAPTQIHPNAWAFIRGFEILMDYLGTTPLLEVFFSFFQAKGVRKGGVVTVNSMQGKALFGLYRQSYKDFKQMYVKVGCVEEQFPFYLDEFGLERFPLYWYSEPVQILGMAKISRESARIVEFLEEFVEKTELLSLTMLFKWEKERTTTGGLKNFFKNRAEGGHSASNVIKNEEGTVVNQPPKKKRVPNMKRRRRVDLEEVKQISERQRRLHGYGGEEDLTSVWSEHFSVSVIAEEHFQSKTDLELLGSVDDKTRAQFMQLALKEKELLEMKTVNEQLKGKLQKFDKEKTELDARVVELCVQKKEAETSKEDHGYDMMAAGFERARKQAEFLFPDIKFDKLDPIKVVHNGALVDDDEVDLEGGGDHNPEE
ncbi:hypothetical protein PIB30_056442 [Stylosanthes scabra]|uniref:Transposase (putative) gypsy type domain-containing protein n=1 Tax=Stylosanthes scabra TaxID=79078 RepID=A0ABU6VIP9_9FABA|nr:hypothetical protein [Stylosanthes scabra]